MSFEVLSTDFTDFFRAGLALKFLPAESPVLVTKRKMVNDYTPFWMELLYCDIT